MVDPAVKVTNVRNVTGFDPVTLLPSRQVQITYTVGDHGPFTHVTTEDKLTSDYIEQVTGKTVQALRTAGALAPHTGA